MPSESSSSSSSGIGVCGLLGVAFVVLKLLEAKLADSERMAEELLHGLQLLHDEFNMNGVCETSCRHRHCGYKRTAHKTAEELLARWWAAKKGKA